MPDKHRVEANVIVVGTGPGGAIVARELARAGKQVLILEKGQDYRTHSLFGTSWTPLIALEGHKPTFTDDGVMFLRPHLVGGLSAFSAGSADEPPAWLARRYGIDIHAEVQETIEELGIAPLPESLRGRASTRIAEAAGELGYTWTPQAKFMTPKRGPVEQCGAHCLLGCTCGARWTAANAVDDAVQAGARLLTGVHISRVLVEDGHVIGVQGHRGGRPFHAYSPVVVLAAGAVGTPRILHESGFPEAGLAFSAGLSVAVYGETSEEVHMEQDPPMTWTWRGPDERYALTTFIEPRVYYLFHAWHQGPGHLLHMPDWHRMLGILLILKDDLSGGIYPDGRVLKPLTLADRERLQTGVRLASRILLQAGAREGTLRASIPRAIFPGASVRVDFLVNSRLETEIEELYVCDASVFPEGLARAPILTIIGLGKRLARQLLTSL